MEDRIEPKIEARQSVTFSKARTSIGRVCGIAVLGAFVGGVFVLLSGFLDIQSRAARAGVVLDLSGTVVAITEPKTPWVALTATAALSLLVVYTASLVVRTLGRVSRRVFVSAFSTVAWLLIAWAFAADEPLRAPIAGSLFTQGWRGWLEFGGTAPVVHLVALLPLGMLLMRPFAKLARDSDSVLMGAQAPESNDAAGHAQD